MEQVEDKKNLVRNVNQNVPNIIQVAWMLSSKNTPYGALLGKYQSRCLDTLGKNSTPMGHYLEQNFRLVPHGASDQVGFIFRKLQIIVATCSWQ